MKCGTCEDVINFPEEVFKCSNCSIYYHPQCVGVREEKFRKMPNDKKISWKCLNCISNARSQTPANNQSQQDSNLNPDAKVTSNEKAFSDICAKLDAISTENKELKAYISSELSAITKSIDFNSSFIQELVVKNDKLEKEIASLNSTLKQVMNENQSLKSTVDMLTSEMIDLQQYSRRSNIEVSEIPETVNENCKEIAESILKALDITDDCEILASHRIPTRNLSRKKPLIIQFQSKAAKEICVKEARSKKLSAKDINPQFPDSPIYVNDHLCPAMKKLFFDVRNFKKTHSFKYCWVRDSKIYLRKDEQSVAIKVRKLSDLPNV